MRVSVDEKRAVKKFTSLRSERNQLPFSFVQVQDRGVDDFSLDLLGASHGLNGLFDVAIRQAKGGQAFRVPHLLHTLHFLFVCHRACGRVNVHRWGEGEGPFPSRGSSKRSEGNKVGMRRAGRAEPSASALCNRAPRAPRACARFIIYSPAAPMLETLTRGARSDSERAFQLSGGNFGVRLFQPANSRLI